MAASLKSRKLDLIMNEITARGLKVTKVGVAYRVTGPGVCVLTSDLAYLTVDALKPYFPSGATWTPSQR